MTRTTQLAMSARDHSPTRKAAKELFRTPHSLFYFLAIFFRLTKPARSRPRARLYVEIFVSAPASRCRETRAHRSKILGALLLSRPRMNSAVSVARSRLHFRDCREIAALRFIAVISALSAATSSYVVPGYAISATETFLFLVR